MELISLLIFGILVVVALAVVALAVVIGMPRNVNPIFLISVLFVAHILFSPSACFLKLGQGCNNSINETVSGVEISGVEVGGSTGREDKVKESNIDTDTGKDKSIFSNITPAFWIVIIIAAIVGSLLPSLKGHLSLKKGKDGKWKVLWR